MPLLTVNEILSRVKTMDGNFMSVTPTASSLKGVRMALEHLRAGGCLGLFPSGAVSDLSLKEGCVRDREWQEPMIRLIMKAKVPIVPVRFFDGNSMFYYSLGVIDWRIRLLRLLPEIFNKKGKTMRIGIGPVISVEQQMEFAMDTETFNQFLRGKVYGM